MHRDRRVRAYNANQLRDCIRQLEIECELRLNQYGVSSGESYQRLTAELCEIRDRTGGATLLGVYWPRGTGAQLECALRRHEQLERFWISQYIKAIRCLKPLIEEAAAAIAIAPQQLILEVSATQILEGGIFPPYWRPGP
jgi:hypothetical protein